MCLDRIEKLWIWSPISRDYEIIAMVDMPWLLFQITGGIGGIVKNKSHNQIMFFSGPSNGNGWMKIEWNAITL